MARKKKCKVASRDPDIPDIKDELGRNEENESNISAPDVPVADEVKKHEKAKVPPRYAKFGGQN
jgi:hypothetical protein